MSEGRAGQSSRPTRVLFVCTHNSARSIMAEALLRHHGGDDFEAHSAGTEPGEVRPLTRRVLQEAGLDVSDLRSKSVDKFVGQSFDYVITVCDQAREACPAFPGSRRTLHWSLPDPSAVGGPQDERLRAFRAVFAQIEERIGEVLAKAAAEERATAS